MRAEFSAVETALSEFIDQPDDPTLLLGTSDNDVVVILKMLQSLEQRLDAAIFVFLAFECDTAEAYVQQCVTALARQIAGVSETRMAEGEPPWPPLPLICQDRRCTPAVRLREAMMHVRTLRADAPAIVWALLPAAVRDIAGYAQMVMPLLGLNGVEDWMEGHRFCVRDPKSHACLIPLARECHAPYVQILPVNFSSARALDSLMTTANDAARPMAERMNALTQLAALDLAHGRLDPARRKYHALHAFHAERQDATGRALALHGLGDVASRQGAVAEAKTRYVEALPIALEGRNLVAVLNLLMAAGNCSSQLGQHAEAAMYFELASTSAGRLMFVNTKIEAMERFGAALLACGKAHEAAKQWLDAKGLCVQFGCERQRQALLGRLASLYAKAGLKAEAKAYEIEKARRFPPAQGRSAPQAGAGEHR
jgi:hypothetical protein